MYFLETKSTRDEAARQVYQDRCLEANTKYRRLTRRKKYMLSCSGPDSLFNSKTGSFSISRHGKYNCICVACRRAAGRSFPDFYIRSLHTFWLE